MEDYQAATDLIQDVDEEEENNRQRPYVIRERTDPLTFYNDFEFKDRFRLSKEKGRELLEQIQEHVEEEGTFHRVTGHMVGVLTFLYNACTQ